MFERLSSWLVWFTYICELRQSLSQNALWLSTADLNQLAGEFQKQGTSFPEAMKKAESG